MSLPTANDLRSVQMLPFVPIVRLAALGVLTALSVIILGIAAHLIQLSVSTINTYSGFAALAIAIPILTLLTVVPSLVFSLLMGATPLYMLIENVWLGVLWILWLGTASYTVSYIIGLPTHIGFTGPDIPPAYPTFGYRGLQPSTTPSRLDIPTTGIGLDFFPIQEIQALQAFSWLNWLILTGYVPTFFVLFIIARSRKSRFVQPAAHPSQQTTYPQQQQMGTTQPVYQQPMTSYVPPQSQAFINPGPSQV